MAMTLSGGASGFVIKSNFMQCSNPSFFVLSKVARFAMNTEHHHFAQNMLTLERITWKPKKKRDSTCADGLWGAHQECKTGAAVKLFSFFDFFRIPGRHNEKRR
jgi:hypothetical protein